MPSLVDAIRQFEDDQSCRLLPPGKLLSLILCIEEGLKEGLSQNQFQLLEGVDQAKALLKETPTAIKDYEAELSYRLAADKSVFQKSGLLAAWKSGDPVKWLFAISRFEERRVRYRPPMGSPPTAERKPVDVTIRHPEMRRAIIAATNRNDPKFFIRLGRLLKEKPKTLRGLGSYPLEDLLITNWLNRDEGQEGLCCFSEKALDDFCKFSLKDKPSLKPRTASRIARRLGLRTKKCLITEVKETAKGIVCS